MATHKPLVKVENLSVWIDRTPILQHISFTLSPGKRIGITGPSGCGKTTLLKSLIGESFLTIQGRVESDKDLVVGYIPQKEALLPWFNVIKNFEILQKIKATQSKEQLDIEDIIVSLDLEGLENNFPHQLSGGQMQRVLMASALCLSPNLVLADEPLTEVDFTTKWEAMTFLSAYLKNCNASLIVVSHDFDVLSYLCDEILVLKGKPSSVVQTIPIESSFDHPRSAEFLQSREADNIRAAIRKALLVEG